MVPCASRSADPARSADPSRYPPAVRLLPAFRNANGWISPRRFDTAGSSAGGSMVLGNSPEVAAGSSASPTVSNGAFLVFLLTGWYLRRQLEGNARPKRATRSRSPH